ncbi:MAG: HEPN domain-containing protein, partial [Bacteroidota bacterium]
LDKLALASPGFNSTADVTACPGTDTCALGVTNSTHLAVVLENLIETEYPDLLKESNLKIKISGCMNSCGQHMAAQIGLHGSSIKRGVGVVPAMQVVMGGGVDPTGKGFVADKVIKLPTKRIPQAIRDILNDYHSQEEDYDYFNDYFQDKGKRYFYNLLKPLADLESLKPEEFQDWGQDHQYFQSIGVGECAGVTLDVVSTILNDAKDKIKWADRSFEEEGYADAIYHAYTAFVIGAKAILLSLDVKCNTHRKILDDFQKIAIEPGLITGYEDFPSTVLDMKKQAPTLDFARTYIEKATKFVEQVNAHREQQLVAEGGVDKLVVNDYYKA